MGSTSDTQLFRNIFNASPIGIAVENLDGQPLFVNPAFCSMLGFSEEELRSKHCVDFSPREDAERDWVLFQQLRAGSIDHYQIEKRYFRRDGSLVWGHLSISLLNSRPSPLVVAMVEDITEKKRAEEVRFRHAAIVESSEDAIASATLDGVIVSWNTGAQRIFGYTEVEAVGKSVTILVPPELPDEENKILETLKAGGRIEQFETVRVTKTGKRINVSLSISPIKDSTGEIVGCSGIARDITERKQREDILRASEERLRLAQSAARFGTFEWNIRTGVNTWTSELEAMYGLPPGGFRGTQAAFESLVYSDDRAGVIELVDRSLKTGESTKGEWRIVWPDGSVHWIAGRWQVFMDESGEPLRIIGVNIDVTQHKRAEEELARANERLQLAIESGSVGGWDFDIKTGKSVWFGKAHAQLGMTPDGTSGSHEEFWARVHKDDRECLEHAIQIAKDKNKDFAAEFRVVWRDGTTHWLRSRGRYQYADGEPERMLGISVDITQSKQVEQALRESEQRFRLATQAGKMYSFEWDVTTGVVVRSPEHVRVLGVTEPLRFTHQQFVDNMHPDDRPKLIAAIAGLTPENPTSEVTYRVLVSDGGFVWLRSSGRAYFDGEGRMLRVIGMVADVTDLKKAEEALLGINRRLIEAQEQERARIGRELHDDISQRIAMLAIHLDILNQGLPTEAAKFSEGITEAQKQVEHLGEGIAELSHRLHSPKLEHLGLATAAASFCRELSDRQKVEIDFHSENIPTHLPEDSSLCLFRVLQEALQNAIKHSGSRYFQVSLLGRASEIELTVQDSGIGFEPREAIKGRGLGLTSMRERLKLVQGELSIESQPAKGTTVHARIPLSPRMMAAGSA